MKCKKCYRQITWALRKRQYWRLVNHGYTRKQASDSMPLCNKCTTKLINGGGK